MVIKYSKKEMPRLGRQGENPGPGLEVKIAPERLPLPVDDP